MKRGSGGASAAMPLDEVTFYDVYKAVECLNDDELFRFHEAPNPKCPVGRNIHTALDTRLCEVQCAMENEMKKITVADVVKTTRECIKAETE